MSEALRELGEFVRAALGGAVESAELAGGELVVRADRAQIVKVLGFLRDDPN